MQQCPSGYKLKLLTAPPLHACALCLRLIHAELPFTARLMGVRMSSLRKKGSRPIGPDCPLARYFRQQQPANLGGGDVSLQSGPGEQREADAWPGPDVQEEAAEHLGFFSGGEESLDGFGAEIDAARWPSGLPLEARGDGRGGGALSGCTDRACEEYPADRHRARAGDEAGPSRCPGTAGDEAGPSSRPQTGDESGPSCCPPDRQQQQPDLQQTRASVPLPGGGKAVLWACQACTYAGNRVDCLRCSVCDTVKGMEYVQPMGQDQGCSAAPVMKKKGGLTSAGTIPIDLLMRRSRTHHPV